WRLEDGAGGRLHNEVEGGSSGGVKTRVSMATAGPRPAAGFEGFDSNNQAARLSGKPGDSLLSLGAGPRHQGLLFQENFNGSGQLDGHGPKVAMGESRWTAAPHFLADGTITTGHGSATVPFQPVDGVVYTLEAALRDLTGTAGVSDWIALGFANGQSTGVEKVDRFVDGMVAGRAWMLFRGRGSSFENTALLASTSDTEAWRNWTGGSGDGVAMRIVLDTTKGSGNWTATWFAKRPGEADFVRVRDTTGAETFDPAIAQNGQYRSASFVVWCHGAGKGSIGIRIPQRAT
ncbi:MAG TPA: hypothetical protein VLD18_09205, partial [Verrucomicrobiae bacterium]|nr:hypothetical protein [Verrucomicrobiae bacterium]